MTSIPSVLRIPVSDLGGAASDQRAVDALLKSMAANRGEWYRYPISIRLISGAQG